MARKSKLGRIDGVPMVAFRVSADERVAIEGAAGALSVNEFARRRTLAGLRICAAPEATGASEPAEAGIRVVYDEGQGS